jgi:hypothetical protein
MKQYGLKCDQIRGIIYLFKNDKMIREKAFYSKWQRSVHLNEFMAISKVGTDDSYYITIKLDI